jgi:peptidyl-dipeptidase A
MKSLVSPLALALALLATTPAVAQTAADADKFVADAEKAFAEFSILNARVQWINNTNITDDTDAVAAEVGTRGTELSVKYAGEAAKYINVKGLSADTKRKLDFLRGGLVLPAPTTAGAAKELNDISTRLNSAYGKGKATLKGKPIVGNDVEAEMGTNRNPEELKEMWSSWHTDVGTPMRKDYTRLVEIANQGAKELGYSDVGAMWRSQYDMPADDFAKLTDKLWLEVKPLYDELHTYVRTKLNAKYGDGVQGKTGPIRADLLGNMWAQEWGDIYELVAPPGSGDIGYDIGDLLKAKGYTPTDPNENDPAKRGKSEIEMVRIGEKFFSPHWALKLCRRAFMNVPSSSSRVIAKWCATLRHGTSTMSMICASKCASRSIPVIS